MISSLLVFWRQFHFFKKKSSLYSDCDFFLNFIWKRCNSYAKYIIFSFITLSLYHFPTKLPTYLNSQSKKYVSLPCHIALKYIFTFVHELAWISIIMNNLKDSRRLALRGAICVKNAPRARSLSANMSWNFVNNLIRVGWFHTHT